MTEKEKVSFDNFLTCGARVVMSTIEIAQLYFNCDFEFQSKKYTTNGKLIYVDRFAGLGTWGDFSSRALVDWMAFDDYISIKPILKHLGDMWKEPKVKEEYKALCKRLTGIENKVVHIADTPHSLIYAINKGYDLFELIENKQAIDAADYKYTLEPEWT